MTDIDALPRMITIATLERDGHTLRLEIPPKGIRIDDQHNVYSIDDRQISREVFNTIMLAWSAG